VAASNALRILSLGMIFYSVFAVFQATIDGIGKPMVNARIIFSMAVSDVLLNIVLIPPYGVTGVAFALFASYLIGVFLSMFYLRKKLSVAVSYPRLAKIFFSAMVSLISVIFLRNFLNAGVFYEFLTAVVAGWIIYIVIIFYSRAVTVEDIKFIESKDIRMPKIIKSIIKTVTRK
jgi:stage V sporulation protein B